MSECELIWLSSCWQVLAVSYPYSSLTYYEYETLTYEYNETVWPLLT